jgi:hypothetical protein
MEQVTHLDVVGEERRDAPAGDLSDGDLDLSPRWVRRRRDRVGLLDHTGR